MTEQQILGCIETAELAAATKDWARALEVLKDAGGAHAISSRRGFYLSRLGRYREAFDVFDGLARADPGNAKWPYMAGYQISQEERWGQAIPLYQRAIAIDEGYLKAWYRLAQAHHRAGNEREAQLAAIRVLRLWHQSPDEEFRTREATMMARASYLLARAQWASDPEGAVELLRQGLRFCGDDPNFHYLLGKALRRAGRPAEALESLGRADRLAPNKPYQQIEMAAALHAAQKPDQAVALVTRVASRCRAWDAYKAGLLALELDQADLALRLLSRARTATPCRGAPQVQAAWERAQALVPAATESAPTRLGGRVVMVRPERSFGFIEDESGVRRHFRLRGTKRFERGDRVTFRAVDATKGPAARDVEPAI